MAMDLLVEQIFEDAGAEPLDLEMISLAAQEAVKANRRAIAQLSELCPKVDLRLPIRCYIARVVHADMQRAFEQFKTEMPDG